MDGAPADGGQAHVAHRAKRAGAKADKKDAKHGQKERHNPRAFSATNIGRTRVTVRAAPSHRCARRRRSPPPHADSA